MKAPFLLLIALLGTHHAFASTRASQKLKNVHLKLAETVSDPSVDSRYVAFAIDQLADLSTPYPETQLAILRAYLRAPKQLDAAVYAAMDSWLRDRVLTREAEEFLANHVTESDRAPLLLAHVAGRQALFTSTIVALEKSLKELTPLRQVHVIETLMYSAYLRGDLQNYFFYLDRLSYSPRPLLAYERLIAYPIRDPRVHRILLRGLTHENRAVQIAAFDALRKSKTFDPRMVRFLDALLQSSDPFTQAQAAVTLAQMPVSSETLDRTLDKAVVLSEGHDLEIANLAVLALGDGILGVFRRQETPFLPALAYSALLRTAKHSDKIEIRKSAYLALAKLAALLQEKLLHEANNPLFTNPNFGHKKINSLLSELNETFAVASAGERNPSVKQFLQRILADAARNREAVQKCSALLAGAAAVPEERGSNKNLN